MVSRRLRNCSTIALTTSCGPRSAASPASWTKEAVQVFELIISRTACGASAAGKRPQPSRQPVIAYAFENPSTRMVRSSIPGNAAIEGSSAVYRIRR